ncbi:hypothetical protein [Rhizobium leguminosarum]|uniref:hypothetical protein n=1 Tax=Rhizobium leguminosarum TaxID=384 RepID=UPI00142E1BD6|nr:hypothetical protein [Rhizobium leguminosarum]
MSTTSSMRMATDRACETLSGSLIVRFSLIMPRIANNATGATASSAICRWIEPAKNRTSIVSPSHSHGNSRELPAFISPATGISPVGKTAPTETNLCRDGIYMSAGKVFLFVNATVGVAECCRGCDRRLTRI